ncbi:oxygen-insensitive NAD(P)H nitroreductase [Halovulum sp. GXIMD14794]
MAPLDSDGFGTTQDITHFAKARYTAKAYDPAKKISDDKIEKIKELLRFSPSSVNGQPWHFILASTDEGKARIARSVEQSYPFNRDSILNASHVVVFASRLEMTEDHLERVLDQEEKDGRFAADPEAFKAQMDGGRRMFINIHKQDLKDLQHWADKQVYLNLGQFLLGVATMGIDATPMEGFEPKILDQEFGLREQGFSAVVVVPIGYRKDGTDYNADLPKSRLAYDDILTEV